MLSTNSRHWSGLSQQPTPLSLISRLNANSFSDVGKMAGVLISGRLFRQFKRPCPPVAPLDRTWRYRLAAYGSFNFATAFDAFPFTGALQKLKIPFRFTRSDGGLQDHKVSIEVHELVVSEHSQLASHDLGQRYSMGCHIIEDFVLKIAHADALSIVAGDC
jgi:hypothetical protein